MDAAQFRQLYGILPEPMLLVSASGIVLATNSTARGLLDSNLQPGRIRLHDLVDDDSAKVDRILLQWQRNRQMMPAALQLKSSDCDGSQSYRAEGALLIPASDGCEALVVLRLLPKVATTQRFLALNERIDALNREILERQRTEAALARTNEDLRCANADLEQFAFSASHDLREPLRMISIYIDLLKRKLHNRIDERTGEFLAHTVQAAKRMESLIHDLLAYTQAASDTHGPAPPVPPDAVLDQALSNLEHEIAASHAVIEREPLPAVAVHQVHLLQVFQNLIGNALKYRAEEPPRISIRARRDGSMWAFCVQDNGIGIDQQYAEQVFGLFKRLHNAEQYSGTGIGLAICQKIVHRYGGRIWVQSDGSGRGSTFCFTLPAPEVDTQPGRIAPG